MGSLVAALLGGGSSTMLGLSVHLNRSYIGIAVALFGTLALMVSAWLWSWFSLGPVGTRLRSELRAGAAFVNLSNMTDFPWTELRIFWPYSNRRDYCSIAQLSSAECERIDPSRLDEGEYLFLFRNGETTQHQEVIPSWVAEFMNDANGQPIGRESAIFAVTPQLGGPDRRYDLERIVAEP